MLRCSPVLLLPSPALAQQARAVGSTAGTALWAPRRAEGPAGTQGLGLGGAAAPQAWRGSQAPESCWASLTMGVKRRRGGGSRWYPGSTGQANRVGGGPCSAPHGPPQLLSSWLGFPLL